MQKKTLRVAPTFYPIFPSHCVFFFFTLSACTLYTQIWHFYEYATHRAIYVVYAAYIKICPIACSTLCTALALRLIKKRAAAKKPRLIEFYFHAAAGFIVCQIECDADMHALFGAKHWEKTQKVEFLIEN